MAAVAALVLLADGVAASLVADVPSPWWGTWWLRAFAFAGARRPAPGRAPPAHAGGGGAQQAAGARGARARAGPARPDAQRAPAPADRRRAARADRLRGRAAGASASRTWPARDGSAGPAPSSTGASSRRSCPRRSTGRCASTSRWRRAASGWTSTSWWGAAASPGGGSPRPWCPTPTSRDGCWASTPSPRTSPSGSASRRSCTGSTSSSRTRRGSRPSARWPPPSRTS